MEKVVYEDLPCRVRGFCIKNDDGTHTIFINAKLNMEQQKEVYLHEKRHMINEDFEKEDIDALEYLVHNHEKNKRLEVI